MQSYPDFDDGELEMSSAPDSGKLKLGELDGVEFEESADLLSSELDSVKETLDESRSKLTEIIEILKRLQQTERGKALSMLNLRGSDRSKPLIQILEDELREMRLMQVDNNNLIEVSKRLEILRKLISIFSSKLNIVFQSKVADALYNEKFYILNSVFVGDETFKDLRENMYPAFVDYLLDVISEDEGMRKSLEKRSFKTPGVAVLNEDKTPYVLEKPMYFAKNKEAIKRKLMNTVAGQSVFSRMVSMLMEDVLTNPEASVDRTFNLQEILPKFMKEHASALAVLLTGMIPGGNSDLQGRLRTLLERKEVDRSIELPETTEVTVKLSQRELLILKDVAMLSHHVGILNSSLNRSGF